jgi:hypothetical protein
MYGFVECTTGQFMTRTVITVNRQTTMRELAVLFEKHDFNAFPVVEDGKLCGIISKFDFLHAFAFTTSQVVSFTDCWCRECGFEPARHHRLDVGVPSLCLARIRITLKFFELLVVPFRLTLASIPKLARRY